MPTTILTNDEIVKRLSLVMICVMLFGILISLSGQPGSYWHHPETAIRGDGLSIYNPTNRTFEFFIGQGWLPYLIASLIYLSAAFLIVSFLPRTAALIVIFSFIFGHSYGAINWLAVRWQLGIGASSIYSVALSALIVYSAFPKLNPGTDKIIKMFRWAAPGTVLIDFINTLLGQPAGYFIHPELVHEGNQVSRFFLMQGWYAFIFYILIYLSGILWLISILPLRIALICIFFFIIVGFAGASNWYYFVWRMGMESPVIFGMILSILIVGLAFPKPEVG
jgi:hypothetical protein